jgi:hypothetical protein
MNIDVAPVTDSISKAIGTAPLAVITIGLLVGPTVLYILFRLLFPSNGSRHPTASTRMLWACPNCRSVNESVHDRCYVCRYRPLPTDELTVIDPVTARPLTAVATAPSPVHAADLAGPVYRGVPVGPGRPETMPGPVGVPMTGYQPTGVIAMAGTTTITSQRQATQPPLSVPSAPAMPAAPPAAPPADGPLPAVAGGLATTPTINVHHVAIAASPGVAPAALPPVGRPVIATHTPGRLGIAQVVGARRPFDPVPVPSRPRGSIIASAEPRITVISRGDDSTSS